MSTAGLNRNQLKYIAIIAMVIDHTAWGFVEFMTPLGITMHLMGRLTLPIMCFFIAEGFRHTHNVKRYLLRMLVFALVAVVPFYIFFHEEYGYRQNIIFDLMLALLTLTVLEEKKIKKPIRIILAASLFVVSAVIGGWVIMPIVYVLVFYYNRDFKHQAGWFCFFTILLVVVLSGLILLNRQYHFSSYDWNIPQWLYLLGFMFALIPLSQYNGMPGENRFGRYFFYLFYPAHFAVLSLIKYLVIH